jgi:hypothetical protein
VEIAAIKPCMSDDGEGNRIHKEAILKRPYNQIPRPGSSIGLRGSNSSGSIAAFFDATIGSQPIQILLTNHHVVVENTSHEPFPPRWKPASADLLSPSPEDLRATQEDINSSIVELTDGITEAEKGIRKRQFDDSRRAVEARQKLTREVECFRADIIRYQAELPSLAESNTEWDLASLAQTSGWRSDQNSVQMDWAVAILTTDSRSRNTVSLQLNLEQMKVLMFGNSFQAGADLEQTLFAKFSTLFLNLSPASAVCI